MVSRLSQWEEFTEFLIEAGMVSREEMSVDAVKKYYASTLQDNTRHDDVSRSHLSPHNKLLTPDISFLADHRENQLLPEPRSPVRARESCIGPQSVQGRKL